MFRNFLINLLFRLLGNSDSKNLYSVSYLFGKNVAGHEGRKLRWEKALVRLWKDKSMLDYLYYQAENDKEAVWRGKLDRKLSQGARIRTLFIVKSARVAYEKSLKSGANPDVASEQDEEIKNVDKSYKEIVDIDGSGK